MFEKQTMIRVPRVDLEKLGLRAVNTVGCGDAFPGAFSPAKALQLTDEEALDWANCPGALKATKPETRRSPTRAELEKWMAATRTGRGAAV